MAAPTTARLTDTWIPLPDEILRRLGWGEGDTLHLDAADGILVVTKADSAPPVVRPRPSKRRALPSTSNQ